MARRCRWTTGRCVDSSPGTSGLPSRNGTWDAPCRAVTVLLAGASCIMREIHGPGVGPRTSTRASCCARSITTWFMTRGGRSGSTPVTGSPNSASPGVPGGPVIPATDHPEISGWPPQQPDPPSTGPRRPGPHHGPGHRHARRSAAMLRPGWACPGFAGGGYRPRSPCPRRAHPVSRSGTACHRRAPAVPWAGERRVARCRTCQSLGVVAATRASARAWRTSAQPSSRFAVSASGAAKA